MGWYILLGTIPIAIFGFAFSDQIESGARDLYLIGTALIVLGFLLLYAEHVARRDRGLEDITRRDGILIGFAQACALVPGVSRNGATITAARLLGFRRSDANRISRDAALPVIAGATALKLFRLRRTRPSPAYAAGFAAAFASGLVAAHLHPRIDRMGSYAPFALYRVGLGLIALRFVRLNGTND
jgi:undecaprenyl-diphosphatase